MRRLPCCVVAFLLAAGAADASCPPGATFLAPPNYVHGSIVAVADFDRDGRVDTLSGDASTSSLHLNLGGPGGVFRRGPAIPVASQTDRMPVYFAGAAADVNGDGNLDAVIAVMSTGAIEVHLGRGDGTFEPARTLDYSWQPLSVAVADFDGDGALDIAVAERHDQRVQIFWGSGDGSFSRPLTLAIEFRPSEVVAGDLDRDGRADLVIGGRDGAVMQVRLAAAGRTFGDPVELVAGDTHWGIVLRDVDGDGALDIAVAVFAHGRVSIFRGNGDGTFGPRVDHASGSLPEGIAFGDVNGDAVADIITGDSGGGRIAVLPGRPDGTFGTPVTYFAGNNVRYIFVADLNRDGREDVLAGDFASYMVLLQTADHRLEQLETVQLRNDVWDIVAADLNADGAPDVAVPLFEEAGAAILLGNGDGSVRRSGVANLGPDPTTMDAVDLNGDGHLDLVAGIRGGVAVALGRGDGAFDPPVVTALVDIRYTTSAGDFDNDGDLDVVALDRRDNIVHFLVNDGGGLLERRVARDVRLSRTPGDVLLADLDGDGDTDLVTTEDSVRIEHREPGFVVVRLGRGDGSFAEPVEYPAGTEPAQVSAGDLDGDGDLDLAVGGFAPPGEVHLFRGTGRGTFRTAGVLQSYGQVAQVALADFDGDGDADLAFPNFGFVVVYENLGDWRFGEPRSHVGSPQPLFLDAADFNGDGRMDLVTPGSFGEITVQLSGPACRRRAVRH